MKIATTHMSASTARRLGAELRTLKSSTWNKPEVLNTVLVTLDGVTMTDEQARKVLNAISHQRRYGLSHATMYTTVATIVGKE